MKSLQPVEFNFKSKSYCAIIRKRFRNHDSQFHVTIMDGSLDKLLSGNDILVVDAQGQCQAASPLKDGDVKELLKSIIEAFQRKAA